MLTGEPLPVAKAPGDPVTGGSINGDGAVLMRAERVGAETMLARIVQMVAEAQRSQAPIQKKVDDVKKQYFGGNEKKFEAGLKAQAYTLDALRDDARAQLVSEGIYKDITSDVKVSDGEAQQYYDQNIDRYRVADSREVRHILVKTKSEADTLRGQLENGASFATLAKEKSLDPGSKEQGGKLTVSKGQTVEPLAPTGRWAESRLMKYV